MKILLINLIDITCIQEHKTGTFISLGHSLVSGPTQCRRAGDESFQNYTTVISSTEIHANNCVAKLKKQTRAEDQSGLSCCLN